MKSGSIMLRDGVVLPKSVPVEMYRFTRGWHSVSGDDKSSLSRKLRTVGWNLVFVAGEIKSISVGSHGEVAVRRTVCSVLSKIGALSLNCANIASISNKRFLGIPYTVVSGYAYNLQHGSRLTSFSQRKRQQPRTKDTSEYLRSESQTNHAC